MRQLEITPAPGKVLRESDLPRDSGGHAALARRVIRSPASPGPSCRRGSLAGRAGEPSFGEATEGKVALIVAGVLLLRRIPLGYLLASTMLIFTCILGPSLTAGGVLQILEEVITAGQAMAFTVPFVILALIAVVLTVRLFRSLSETAQGKLSIKRQQGSLHRRYSPGK